MKALYFLGLFCCISFLAIAQEENVHINQIDNKSEKIANNDQATSIMQNQIMHDITSLHFRNSNQTYILNDKANAKALIITFIDSSTASEIETRYQPSANGFLNNVCSDSAQNQLRNLENYINNSIYRIASNEEREILLRVSLVNSTGNNDIKGKAIYNQFGEVIDLMRVHESSVKDVGNNISGVIVNVIQNRDIDINELGQEMDNSDLQEYLTRQNAGMVTITPNLKVRSNGNIVQIIK